MAFATRADLLARSNAQRLAQLSVPTDMDMVPNDALRVAIAGGDLSGYSAAEQLVLAASLATIDKALGDADALILSYGIPPAVQTTLLARLASVIALYYLQGAERLDKQDAVAYDGAIATLKAHARGDMNLIPAAPSDPVPSSDMAVIESRPGRYGRYSWPDDEVGL